MKMRQTIGVLFFAGVLLLGSGLLRGLAWCADSLCITCGDQERQGQDFDSGTWHDVQDVPADTEKDKASSKASAGKAAKPSGRNYIKSE